MYMVLWWKLKVSLENHCLAVYKCEHENQVFAPPLSSVLLSLNNIGQNGIVRAKRLCFVFVFK